MAGALMSTIMVALILGGMVPTRAVAKLDSRCPTGFANFGDSLTDTGNLLNALPYVTDAENSPYGETFFGKPAKRFSNGRVVPDFFSLAFRQRLLDPYFSTTSFDYKHGINFAVSGATAAFSSQSPLPFCVYPLQVSSFIRFKNAAANALQEGKPCANFISDLPVAGDPYSGWLYTIQAGSNDIIYALGNNASVESIINSTIPIALGNISAAIQTLYSQSARKFLLFNIVPLGCSLDVIATVGTSGLPTDSFGCIDALNQVAVAFNTGLNQSIQGLRQALPDAAISLFDYYGVYLDVVQNPASYGFNPNVTLTACCGAPGFGSYNFNPAIPCGSPQGGFNVCSNVEEYLNWDGMHPTEHYYRIISELILSGKYTDNPVNYTALCDLDFSKFGPNVTLPEAYPCPGCNSDLFV